MKASGNNTLLHKLAPYLTLCAFAFFIERLISGVNIIHEWNLLIIMLCSPAIWYDLKNNKDLRISKKILFIYIYIFQPIKIFELGGISAVEVIWVFPLLMLSYYGLGLDKTLKGFCIFALVPLVEILNEKVYQFYEVGYVIPREYQARVEAIFFTLLIMFIFEKHRNQHIKRIIEEEEIATKKKYIATIQHELNNPLTIIQGLVDKRVKEVDDEQLKELQQEVKKLIKDSAYLSEQHDKPKKF